MERLILFHLRQADRTNGPETRTIIDQMETESLVSKAYYEKLCQWKDDALRLFKLNHINYLHKRLFNLPMSFEHLDASQPWLAYWIVHALKLLNFVIPEETSVKLLSFLASSQHPEGGFGGGPYQFAHLATTYGAVNCLASMCRRDALDIVNRDTLVNWMRKLHQPDGSFLMHLGGEADVRGAYCAAAVAKLTGLLNKYPDLFESTAEWVASCQTYEGGFGGQPGLEAHGGYAFCAVATLCLLGRSDLIDLPRLLHWVSHRQMATEGGFQGRTNKLVDSCYSFWQGAIFPIVEELLWLSGDSALNATDTLFNPPALQEYILLCCQKVSYTRPGLSVHTDDSSSEISPPSNKNSTPEYDVSSCDGGLIDKPGKNPDPYHTCYSLSGLSIAQHSPRCRFTPFQKPYLSHPTPAIDLLGEELGNELVDLDPIHNIIHDGLAFTITYFSELDNGQTSEYAEKSALAAAEEYSVPMPPLIQNQNSYVEFHTSHISDDNNGNTVFQPSHTMSTCTTP
ncbi:Protein farnesyltransferase subunit beta [Schistosoma japonicum]|uniref:Protein farnesyltransferase subunit beta n=2 Tax=Schistosoma japonicum TaxID=6182 RepID=A0A4Z2CTI9_SCHJA|nr:Protein farnesyltransferase subunit beta [Schistosoma japonicum]TNN07525.1 Protein farnesyltransferase subunit beta [Schistosoma japonicum]